MFHQLKLLALVGPPMMVPRAFISCEPRRIPDVEGVARTLRMAVVWTRSFVMNLVDGGGGGEADTLTVTLGMA